MQEENQYSFITEPDEEGMRLDQLTARNLPAQSRSYIQKLIKQGKISVNGGKKKSSYEVKSGDVINVVVPSPVPLEVLPEPIPLDILFEDENLLVVNKPSGLVVHPGAGHKDGTLVNALVYHCEGKLSGIGGVLRPGIVHRLDKDTSGCIVVAKNDLTHKDLTRQFQERLVNKEYLALVKGWVKELSGTLQTMIGRHPVHRKKMTAKIEFGKEAITQYEVEERFEDASFLKLFIKTGRTHQIRVHMAHIGHPVLGDEEYGQKNSRLKGIVVPRQMLHSHRLGLNHPLTGNFIEFEAPVPDDMQALLDYLNENRTLGNERG